VDAEGRGVPADTRSDMKPKPLTEKEAIKFNGGMMFHDLDILSAVAWLKKEIKDYESGDEYWNHHSGETFTHILKKIDEAFDIKGAE
jgi:hypothetical protein